MRVSYTTPDTLHITVKRAEQLCAKTKSCSPYAMCTLLGEYKVQTTEVQVTRLLIVYRVLPNGQAE